MTAVNEVLFGKIGRLRDTYRYSAQPVIIRESVAEHSFWTAMIGVSISYQLEPGDDTLAEKIALKGILHDIEECMTGDLVRDMKYANSDFREAVKNVEFIFMANLMADLEDVGEKFFDTWQQSKNQTFSGQVVALADALSVISYCTREYTLGNQNLLEIHQSCVQLIVDKFYQSPISGLATIAMEAIAESNKRWGFDA